MRTSVQVLLRFTQLLLRQFPSLMLTQVYVIGQDADSPLAPATSRISAFESSVSTSRLRLSFFTEFLRVVPSHADGRGN